MPYRRDARRYGTTQYNLLGNTRFAIAGILAATTFPLRAVFYALPLVCLLDILIGVLFAAGVVATGGTVVGLLLVNGLYVAGAVSFISIYLARTYQNGLGRRRFIVDRALSALPDRAQEPRASESVPLAFASTASADVAPTEPDADAVARH